MTQGLRFFEAGYKGLIDGTAEIIWLQYLLIVLQILSVSAPIIQSDNLGATYIFVNPNFMLTQNMLRLISIFSKIELRRRRLRFILFPLQINLHMSLLSHFLLLRLLLFISSFGSILRPQLEGAYYRMYTIQKILQSLLQFCILYLNYCILPYTYKQKRIG